MLLHATFSDAHLLEDTEPPEELPLPSLSLTLVVVEILLRVARPIDCAHTLLLRHPVGGEGLGLFKGIPLV